MTEPKKIWVAYAIPRSDYHLVVEDGLGYISVGTTAEAAIASLRAIFAKEYEEQNERAVKAGYEPDPEPYAPDEDYVIHANEV